MRNFFLIAAGIIVIVLMGVGVYILRSPAEASAPIQAMPVALTQDPLPTLSPTQAEALVESTSTAPTQQPPAVESGEVVYQIVQAESQVSFAIDEILRGNPFTAVGTTDQVAGEVAIDFEQARVQLGTIQVNARTLRTDSSTRDRVISNQILQTESYEFITFEPTSISGLPATFEPGQEIFFQITGNLTIRDITQAVIFDATVKYVSPERLEGAASAIVLRSDYQIVIPEVPSVANVSDEVSLEIRFVAVRK